MLPNLKYTVHAEEEASLPNDNDVFDIVSSPNKPILM